MFSDALGVHYLMNNYPERTIPNNCGPRMIVIGKATKVAWLKTTILASLYCGVALLLYSHKTGYRG